MFPKMFSIRFFVFLVATMVSLLVVLESNAQDQKYTIDNVWLDDDDGVEDKVTIPDNPNIPDNEIHVDTNRVHFTFRTATQGGETPEKVWLRFYNQNVPDGNIPAIDRPSGRSETPTEENQNDWGDDNNFRHHLNTDSTGSGANNTVVTWAQYKIPPNQIRYYRVIKRFRAVTDEIARVALNKKELKRGEEVPYNGNTLQLSVDTTTIRGLPAHKVYCQIIPNKKIPKSEISLAPPKDAHSVNIFRINKSQIQWTSNFTFEPTRGTSTVIVWALYKRKRRSAQYFSFTFYIK